MVELEIYASGLRSPEKMMSLALELESVAGLRYKVDTNHDIVYLEFLQEPCSLGELASMFRRAGLDARFVGVMPPEVDRRKKTQRIQVA